MAGQPPEIGVLLHRIDVGRGRQELYLDQLPELLEAMATNLATIQQISAGVSEERADEGVWPFREILAHIVGSEVVADPLAFRADPLNGRVDPRR